MHEHRFGSFAYAHAFLMLYECSKHLFIRFIYLYLFQKEGKTVNTFLYNLCTCTYSKKEEQKCLLKIRSLKILLCSHQNSRKIRSLYSRKAMFAQMPFTQHPFAQKPGHGFCSKKCIFVPCFCPEYFSSSCSTSGYILILLVSY